MAWVVGGTPPNMQAATVKRIKKPKAPNDLIPITVDFRGALSAVEDDALLVTVPPVITTQRNDDALSDIVFVPPAQFSPDATRLIIWLAQGTATFEYLISITTQSVLGQTLERSFILPVYFR